MDSELLVKDHEKRHVVIVHDSAGSSNRVIRLVGEGAHVIVDEVFLASNVTSNLKIVHESPRTISRVRSRGVVESGVSAVCTVVVIPKGSFLSDSHVSQRFLLLSNSARADAVPCLEIEANEVKAGHAASVAPLDEDVLFYLVSRGLSLEQARCMVIDAFLAIPSEVEYESN